MNGYDYQTARSRLLMHSPLPQVDERYLSESFTFELERAEREGTPPRLELAEDVIACMQALNREFNGEPASCENRRGNPLPDNLQYAVSGIIVSCLRHHIRWRSRRLFSEETLDELQHTAYLIAFAWDQLLAGDIEGLIDDTDLDLEL